MALTIEKAQQILDDYYDLTHTKYEDDISLIHALEFLIQETKDPEYMVELGGWYYEQRQFDLAEEYYLMAASLEYVDAYECLGYIYYYGRVGQPDYKKAFHYYKLASEKGNLVAAYKLADMYKNGYYVSKDYAKYVEIMKSLYPLIQGATNTFDPVPEIYSRLAKIYVDLFDLYYALQKPCKVAIEILGDDHIIEAKYEDGLFYICMDDKNYEDVDQFFLHAKVNEEPISTQYVNVNYIEILD